MLEWPERAFSSIVHLFRPLQDLDVYVEDKGSEAFYSEFLQRVVGESPRIARVFPLGGRKAVIEKCLAYSESTPALFIIDGDLNMLTGEEKPVHPRLFVLDAYCVENYLICEQAASQLVAETDGRILAAQASAKLSWDAWRREIMGVLVPLFEIFGAARKVAPDLQTVAHGVGRLCVQEGKVTKVCPEKTMRLREDTQQALVARIGEEEVGRALATARNSIQGLAHPLDAVSGKDFLIPLLRFRLAQHVSAHAFSDASLKFRLARHCNVGGLQALRVALKEAR